MIRSVSIAILVAEIVARPDHERRPELIGALARNSDSMPCLPGADRLGVGIGMEELVEANSFDRRHARGRGVIVDEYREGNPVVLDERARESRVAGADDHDFTTGRRYFRILVAQLRGMRTAIQSAEVPQKDERHVAIAPVIAEALAVRLGILQRHVREGSEIHMRSVDLFGKTGHGADARFSAAPSKNSNSTFTAPDFP